MTPEEKARQDAQDAAAEYGMDPTGSSETDFSEGEYVPDPLAMDRTGETQDALNAQFAAQQAGQPVPEMAPTPTGVELQEPVNDYEVAAQRAEQLAQQQQSTGPAAGQDGLATLVNERYWQPQRGVVVPGGIRTASDTYTHAAETALPGKEPQYNEAKDKLEQTEDYRMEDQRVDAMKRADAFERDKTQAVAQVRAQMARYTGLRDEQAQRRADADRLLEPLMAEQAKLEEEASKQDPNAMMGVSSGFGRFVMGLGVAMGAGAATVAGGPNHALDFVKSMMQQKAEERRARMTMLGERADVALKTIDAKYMNPVAADHAIQAAWAAAMEADLRRKAATAQTQDERIRMDELANEMAVHRDTERKKAFAAEHQVLMRNVPARVVGAHPGGIQGLRRMAEEMGVQPKDQAEFIFRALADPNAVGIPGSAAEGIRERGTPGKTGPKTLQEVRVDEAERSRRIVVPENLKFASNGVGVAWASDQARAQKTQFALKAASSLMDDLPLLRNIISKSKSDWSPTERKEVALLVERNKTNLSRILELGAITEADQKLLNVSSASDVGEMNLYDDVAIVDKVIAATKRTASGLMRDSWRNPYSPPSEKELISQPVRERPTGGNAPDAQPEPAAQQPAQVQSDHLDPTVAAAMTPFKEG